VKASYRVHLSFFYIHTENKKHAKKISPANACERLLMYIDETKSARLTHGQVDQQPTEKKEMELAL